MRALPPGLQAALDSGATHLCWCWKLIRKDGTVLAFTEHDSDLAFDNLVWKSSTGLRPGVMENATGFTAGTSHASGALSMAGISAGDIDAGKYDQAAIEVWRVDWQDPSLRVGIFSGEIGDISRRENAFEAEIIGPAHKLGRSFGRVFSKRCDAELGDARCTKDVSAAPFARPAAVTRLVDQGQFAVIALAPPAPDWFDDGTVFWQSGANAGASFRISHYGQNGGEDIFAIAELPRQPIALGDTLIATAGCNKSLDHCVNKFVNVSFFRGCPFMPGNDSLIAGSTKN